MAKKGTTAKPAAKAAPAAVHAGKLPEGLPSARPSSLLDTRVVYCGDNLEQLIRTEMDKLS